MALPSPRGRNLYSYLGSGLPVFELADVRLRGSHGGKVRFEAGSMWVGACSSTEAGARSSRRPTHLQIRSDTRRSRQRSRRLCSSSRTACSCGGIRSQNGKCPQRRHPKPNCKYKTQVTELQFTIANRRLLQPPLRNTDFIQPLVSQFQQRQCRVQNHIQN